MDKWIVDFISRSFSVETTIQGFVSSLASRLTSEMYGHELEIATIIHIAGYSKDEYNSYAEHWHVSNTGLIDGGHYSTPRNDFAFHNDFNTRTNLEHRVYLNLFDEDAMNHQFYINGYPTGRISLMAIKTTMDRLLNDIWNISGWLFRKPINLFETANVLKLYFNFVSELFKMSDHNALYIGGEIQTFLIHVPEDLNKSLED